MFEMRNMKIVIYVNFTGPLIDISKSAQKNDNLGTRGDRRIDIDSSAIHANASKTSENKQESSLNKTPDSEEYQDYYADYDKLLKDYYEGDYNEEASLEDDISISEESEEELPQITRTPRTPSKDVGRDTEIFEDQSSRPLVGRKILSANPEHLHFESQHEMDHMMMMMLRNAIGLHRFNYTHRYTQII